MSIGGHTITELQAKITHTEFMTWLAYRQKFGPMNPVRKYDAGPAMLSSFLLNVMGGAKTKPRDFMPYGLDPIIEQPPEPTIEEFIQALGGSRVNKRR